MGRPTATPERNRIVTLADRRQMASAEWGPPDGRPVVLLHGMPGSRLFCPDLEQTVNTGVRLITIDRPGYGLSTPNPGRTLLNWVDDFVEWGERIGLPPCPIVGWSSGGAYALACAARCPQRATAVGLAASPGPVDGVPGAWERLPTDTRGLVELLRRDRNAALGEVRARCAWFARGWQTMFEPGAATSPAGSGAVDPDDALLAGPAVLEAVRAWMGEAARQGTAGFVEDWVAEKLPWGFSLATIDHPVQVWWGDGDTRVARADAEYLADAIGTATLHVVAGGGHLFPIQHWGAMLGRLLAPNQHSS